MQLLAWIEGPDHVCWRYRLAAFEPLLRHRGWQIDSEPLAQGAIARTRQLLRSRQADVNFLQRRLLSAWHLALLRRSARRLIFDLDDAVFLRDSNAKKPPHSSRRLARFRATVRAADAVLAGNAYLVSQAARWTSPAKVFQIPTCIDPARYTLASHNSRNDSTTLAWIGSHSTLTSLVDAQAALAAAAQRVAGLRLHAICDVAPPFVGIPTELRPWSSAFEAAELAQADIGISWLPEHPWSLGKCGLKVLQYMAAGLPVIANPVGVHRDLIVDGETGFLAASPREWAVATARLAGDLSLRRRMGMAARRRVEQEYSVGRWGHILAAILDSLSDRVSATVPPPLVAPRLQGNPLGERRGG